SFLYARADLLVTVTKGLRDMIVQKGIPRDKVYVVTNGSDLELFSPEGQGADLRALLPDLPSGPFISLFLGNLGEAYDLGVILDAACELRDDNRFHFVFLGAGRQRAALGREVKKQGLTNVHFLDPVPKAQVPRYLRSADVGLVTLVPRKYSFIFLPFKFFDHLACGCPLILNYDGEAREWIEGAKAGVYVPPRDAGALARAIRLLASDKEAILRMRKNARLLAELEFGWDRKEEQYRQILITAMSSFRKHG
ncbi:MAG: glycosyltransferase family 4 protein, partial [Acidobacteria bacterium]|nr:glycosyltransferase family 4 protein [Acidobacteriota bacterium]